MAEIKIHGVPPSTFTRTVRLACHEKGINLDKTREVVPIFDRQLGKSRYLAGDAVTAADLFLAPVLFYFPDIPELRAIADSAPNCARWAREMAARPSVVATEPADKPRLAA
jgi:glutathione S-transferase